MKNTRVKSSGDTNLTQTPGKFLKMLTQEEENLGLQERTHRHVKYVPLILFLFA